MRIWYIRNPVLSEVVMQPWSKMNLWHLQSFLALTCACPACLDPGAQQLAGSQCARYSPNKLNKARAQLPSFDFRSMRRMQRRGTQESESPVIILDSKVRGVILYAGMLTCPRRAGIGELSVICPPSEFRRGDPVLKPQLKIQTLSPKPCPTVQTPARALLPALRRIFTIGMATHLYNAAGGGCGVWSARLPQFSTVTSTI